MKEKKNTKTVTLQRQDKKQFLTVSANFNCKKK